MAGIYWDMFFSGLWWLVKVAALVVFVKFIWYLV